MGSTYRTVKSLPQFCAGQSALVNTEDAERIIMLKLRAKPYVKLLSGVAVICMPSFASAQPEVDASSLEDQSGSEGVSTSERSAPIIVTAQRRSERALDVPISLTSVGSSDLDRAGISDLRSLPQLVPGLLADQTGVIFQPAIRGSSSLTTPGACASGCRT